MKAAKELAAATVSFVVAEPVAFGLLNGRRCAGRFVCVGEKFVDGEIHSAKDVARVGGGDGRGGILFGQTEGCCGYNELYGAFHADYGEHADRSKELIYAHAVNKVTLKTFTDSLGNRICTDAAVAKVSATLNELEVETDGGSNFYHNRGKCGFAVAFELRRLLAEAVVVGVGGKDTYVLLAAVKNDFLVKHAESLYLVGFGADAGFNGNAEKVSDVHLEVALIKGYGVNGYVGSDYINILTANSGGTVDDFLCAVAEENLNVL